MFNPRELYAELTGAPIVPGGLPLIAAMSGFTDTGATVAQLSEHILNTLEAQTVIRFDLDELYDYRARRPSMFFDGERLGDYSPPVLEVALVKDDGGRQFLFLHGVEPDFRWNAFVDAIKRIVAEFEVSSFSWVHAIPMPTPHTRPIGVTVSGNRSELTEAMSVWRPQTQVPTNAVHLLEYRLAEMGVPTVGFVLLIPHYLGDTEFPDAPVRAMECLTAATGLMFPTDELREAGRVFAHRVNEQVADNQELAQLISSLEKRHDEYMEGSTVRSSLVDADGSLPDADQLAAELERFLANRPDAAPGDENQPSAGYN